MTLSGEMTRSGYGPVDRTTLAEEAGPARQWLLRYFGRRISDNSEVEDMVQDVFARIVARDGGEPIEHLGGYILKTAISALADRTRRRQTHAASSHVAFDPELHSGEEIDAERVLSGKEELHAATMALLSLPERTRTVFVLHRLEGRKYREIAAHLGVSVSAVEKHMVRAIQHLSLEMDKRRGS